MHKEHIYDRRQNRKKEYIKAGKGIHDRWKIPPQKKSYLRQMERLKLRA